MSLEDLKSNPEWKEILAKVAYSLDTAQGVVIHAAGSELNDKVRFKAGYHAGVKSVYDYLRSL